MLIWDNAGTLGVACTSVGKSSQLDPAGVVTPAGEWFHASELAQA
jgi:hypothetical protein